MRGTRVSREFWDARYAESAVWSREPNAWIEQAVGHLPPGSAVDLGAGEGRHALWLASLGWRVTAVDSSPVGLATGRRRAEELTVQTAEADEIEWIEADATTWVSPTPVDLVVVAYLQLPAPELAAAIDTAAGYLVPGGTLALIGHDRENLDRGTGGPKDPRILHTVDELLVAASRLEVVECRQFERTTVDGALAIDATLIARAR